MTEKNWRLWMNDEAAGGGDEQQQPIKVLFCFFLVLQKQEVCWVLIDLGASKLLFGLDCCRQHPLFLFHRIHRQIVFVRKVSSHHISLSFLPLLLLPIVHTHKNSHTRTCASSLSLSLSHTLIPRLRQNTQKQKPRHFSLKISLSLSLSLADIPTHISLFPIDENH